MDRHEPNTKEVLVKAFGSLSKGLPLGTLLLGITRRIRRLSYLSSSLFPSGKLANVMASLKSLDKLPNTRIFIAAEK